MDVPDANSATSPSGVVAAFVVRPATPEDVTAIRALEIGTPSAAHWSERAYLDMFSSGAPPRIALVIERASALGGFVIARVASGDCELENIAVAQSLQRLGAGSMLLRSLVAAARDRKAESIFLEVRNSNAPARALYEACGFVITGRRAGYYSGAPEDAILYGFRL